MRSSLLQKCLLSMAALSCLVLSASRGVAAEHWTEVFFNRCRALEKQAISLAERTIRDDKPSAETSRYCPLEEKDIDDLWFLEWKKNGTTVSGASQQKGGQYHPYGIEIRDPDIVFPGGIRVGAGTEVLESYFKGCLNRSDYPEDFDSEYLEYENELPPSGTASIGYLEQNSAFLIECKGGRITSIAYGVPVDMMRLY